MKINNCLLWLLLLCFLACTPTTNELQTQVLVIGEGTGATTAAIQSARSGAKTILVTPQPWLGGMMTAAGVSAIDGNHQLPAGLWGEFRDSLRKHYGGIDALATGWVSNTQFEPSIGNYYWKQIAAREPNLTILYTTKWENIVAAQDTNQPNWSVTIIENGQTKKITAKILIDGTDLGDVAAAVGATYDVGMDAKAKTLETMASEQANDIIQDLTYVVILKDYGKQADKTIAKPAGYDAASFYCACQTLCNDDSVKAHPCETMLTYGKLPNNKYMINWPLKGNDYYVNAIAMNDSDRKAAFEKAKNKTLQFLYFIQTELGYKHLGIAADEFPSSDGLALMPYHREGRRVHGLVQLNVNHILKPYDFNLYRTGIAVGDYPIDHHHYERPDAPVIEFPKVPSFNIPIGALIPKNIEHFLIADKAISVTNIVNGASRLQPVMIQVGQVAGILAAMAVKMEVSPKAVPIRALQETLLAANGYLMPFLDVPPSHLHFHSIQKIGATGLLKGTGIPYQWANQTWFYPDSTILFNEFVVAIQQFDSTVIEKKVNLLLSVEMAIDLVWTWAAIKQYQLVNPADLATIWKNEWNLGELDWNRPIKRAELAVLLDNIIHPFEQPIDFEGNFIAHGLIAPFTLK